MVKDKPHDQETDITSDLSLLQAMTRRALAMDLVGMASFNTVMKFVNRLFALLTQSPAPGFGRPGHAQLLRADRQASMRLAETVSPPYHINAAGMLPLDLAFDQLHNDVTVTYHMLPVPLGRHRDDDKTSNAAGTKTPPIKKTPGGKKTGGAPSSKAKGEARTRGSRCHISFMGCITRRLQGKQSVSTSIWASARIRNALVNMCVACQGATRTTLRRNMRANENRLAEDPKGTLCNALRQTMCLRCQLMMEQRTILSRYLWKAASVLNCFAVQLASLRASGHFSLIVLELITK